VRAAISSRDGGAGFSSVLHGRTIMPCSVPASFSRQRPEPNIHIEEIAKAA
jgi:hypothetical protein